MACGFLIEAPRTELHDALDTDSQGRKLLPGDALKHLSAQIFTSRRTQRSSGREKVRKVTPLVPSRNRRALTVTLNPSAVHGTIINFPPFIWVDRLLGQSPLLNPGLGGLFYLQLPLAACNVIGWHVATVGRSTIRSREAIRTVCDCYYGRSRFAYVGSSHITPPLRRKVLRRQSVLDSGHCDPSVWSEEPVNGCVRLPEP